jgi:hypothetical protein
MTKDKKTGTIKAFLSKLIGVTDWKLKTDGHLDVSPEELTRLTTEYGPDFVSKFEKLLSEENDDKSNNQIISNMPKELKLAILCAILSVESLQAADDGSVMLNKEQLDKIEAGLKKLQDEKTAAESTLATAKSDKETAESALSAAIKAMDELDATVAAAKTTAEKVEAIRTKLAAKPAVIPAGNALGADGKMENVIEGKDEINAFAQQFKS